MLGLLKVVGGFVVVTFTASEIAQRPNCLPHRATRWLLDQCVPLTPVSEVQS